jgi:hypothetical protein
MSVAAVVTYKKSTDDNSTLPAADRPGYLPVATEADFHRYWLPLAAQHDLDLIKQFGTGVSVPKSSFDDLLAELDILRDAATGPDPGDRQLRARVDLLIQLVQGLERSQVDELFIG